MRKVNHEAVENHQFITKRYHMDMYAKIRAL